MSGNSKLFSHKLTRVPLAAGDEEARNQAYKELLERDCSPARLAELFPHCGPFWTQVATDERGQRYMLLVDIRTRESRCIKPDGSIVAAPFPRPMPESFWQEVAQLANAAAIMSNVGPEGLIPVVLTQQG